MGKAPDITTPPTGSPLAGKALDIISSTFSSPLVGKNTNPEGSRG